MPTASPSPEPDSGAIDRGRTPAPLRILLVDDDLLSARLLAANMRRPGRFAFEVVGSGDEAWQAVLRGGVDAVVTDLSMPEMDGIELVRKIRQLDRSLPVVVLTANASIERAVEAIRAGATDFLQKPANVTALTALVERAVAERPVREELAARLERRVGAGAEAYLQGSHPRLDAIRAFAEQVAAVPEARVLLTGETGTGKSRLALAMHELSGVPGRFVEVNCAALPAHLLESELFGHEKGAFTDARALKRGLVELADRGTLFLDEISELPLEMQAKLLLFLERREIRRVGGTESIAVRCRLVTATNQNLRQRVRDRAFRQDLLYRLDVASLEMPPLREMPSVIPELAAVFARELSQVFNRPAPALDADSFAGLLRYEWPGNARELRNAVERALIFHGGGPLVVNPPVMADSTDAAAAGPAVPYGLTLEDVERRYLAAELERRSGQDLAAIARDLGISRKTLWEKRRRYGL